MKRTLFIIVLIIMLLAACLPSPQPGKVPPPEESVSTDTVAASKAIPEFPTDKPAPTAEPLPQKNLN